MNIGIVGLGAIGASIAWALSRAGYENVFGHDIDKNTMEIAMENNYISDFFVEPKLMLEKSDIIFICLYPSKIGPYYKKYLNFFKKEAIITDVSGIKTSIVKELEPSLGKRPDLDFVLAHPMRGSEKVGIEGASYKQFLGANTLITPIKENRERSIRLIEKLYKDMGFNIVTRVYPQEHDYHIAYASQLMHVLAVAAVNSADEKQEDENFASTFAGNSFQELTRISDINVDLWSDLFLNNKEPLLNVMDRFRIEFDLLYETIASESQENLNEIFCRARKIRKDWYK